MKVKTKNKGLLIVGGGLLQVAALKKARDLGYVTYLVDGSEHCFARSYADHFFLASTKDVRAVADIALGLKRAGKIVGVYTQGTDVAYTVAYAAKKSGLPHIPPRAAKNCNDKIAMRTILSRNGLDHTPFAVARSHKDLPDVIKKVGFPCYVKPADNCASRGVTRVTKASDLAGAFDLAYKYCHHTKAVLIEKEINGIEYSVDTVLYKGVLYHAGISDRVFLKKNKYAVQSGSMTPSMLKEEIQEDMYKVMAKAAKALGVKDGAFKGDLVVDEHGVVKIIEVTARTSGGFDSQIRKPLSFGIDIIKATIDIACGLPLNPVDLVPKWVKWSCTTSVFPKPGKVVDIKGLDRIKSFPGVHEVILLTKIGDKIEPYVHSATRTNYVIYKSDTYEGLRKTEKFIQKNFQIITK